MVVSWWNGGGRLIPRIRVNPELTKFITTKPDIFVYGESLMYRMKQNIIIPGYKVILHTAKRNGLRRGLAVYYKEKYANIITREKSSKRFDILWIRMKSPQEENVFCFFYCPGISHEEETREMFYDELRNGVDKFAREKKTIFLLGDTNARLGACMNDRNIHGDIKTNRNKSLLMGFLRYTGMICLNRIFARGQPTYEIVGKKRSIIDFGITNNISRVKSFRVMPQILGCNAQTCHKILKLTISTKNENQDEEQMKEKKFRHCTYEALLKVKGEVARRMKTLRLIRQQRSPGPEGPSIYKYEVLNRLYRNAKKKNIGYRKQSTQRVPQTLVIKTLQEKINETTTMLERESAKTGRDETEVSRNIEALVHRMNLLERELYSQWTKSQQRKFSKWLGKLNTLDYYKATRTFFAELNSMNRNAENFGPIVNKNGQISTSRKQCLKNWKEFYEELYRGTDRELKENTAASEKLKITTLTKAQANRLDKEITMEEIVDAMFTLKADTAAGRDSILSKDLLELMNTNIQSEHENNREVMRFIHKIITNLWTTEKVPASFKETVIRPFLKDPEKDPTDPGNYRPVSLLNTLMKVYEQVLKERVVAVLEENNYFSTIQAAYRKGRSTADHILVLQELFYHYRYTKIGLRNKKGMVPLYMAFMDLTKAFDTVPRKLLFQKLRIAGVGGKMLRVIKNLYSNNRAKVRIGDYESEYFNINSGVMQGSKLGPILFNIFINDLLVELHNSKAGAKIGRCYISALGFADDVSLVADRPEKLQALIVICGKWAEKNGMSFNISKCKAMVLNRSKKGLSFSLSGTEIEIVEKIKYLGVIWSRSRQTSLYSRHISKMLEKAETRINAIRHMGFHSDGLRPETSVRMYKILVRPILEYAAQVLSYSHYYVKERKANNIEEPTSIVRRLEKFQNRVLKKLISCPKMTPPAVLRLLTGIMPISGRIDMLKLRYFWKIHNSMKDTPAKNIYEHNRKQFLQSNKGYVHEVFNLCCKYGRMDIWHGVCPKKVNPYSMIKKIVDNYHYAKDVQRARATNCVYTSLTVFDSSGKYKIDERLTRIGQFRNSEHRRIFLYALLDTGGYTKDCKHCGERVTDLTEHCLAECKAMEKSRYRFKLLMLFYNAPETTKFDHKGTVYSLAFTESYYMTAVCDFLKEVWEEK